MDEIVFWEVTGDVESLVSCILECMRKLEDACRKKYGRATTETCDAYAAAKVLELLQLSEKWVPVVDFTEEDMTTSLRVRSSFCAKVSYRVAKLGDVSVHRDTIMPSDAIRVVSVLDTGRKPLRTMYGNVELIPQKSHSNVDLSLSA